MSRLPVPYWCADCGAFRTVRTDGEDQIRYPCDECDDATTHETTSARSPV